MHGAGLGHGGRQIGLDVFDVVALGHFFGLFIPCASSALLPRLVRDHQIGVDVGFHMAWRVHAGGVDLEPAFGGFAAYKGGAAHVGDLLHGLAGGQAVGDLDNRPLGVAVQQQVTFAVHHDGAAHFVRPVVVMRDASQTAFDAAQDNRHIWKGFTAALAVHDGRSVGPLAAHIARGVSIVSADFAISCVTVDHGVHVACRDAPKQIGFAQGFERVCTLPIGLGNDAHAKTLVFEHAANDRHTETGVIHIGVASHDDDVTTVPAELVHFCTVHRQKRRSAKTRRPILSVTGQRLGITREKRDVGEGVHEGS